MPHGVLQRWRDVLVLVRSVPPQCPMVRCKKGRVFFKAGPSHALLRPFAVRWVAGPVQGCIRRDGTAEAAPESVRKAVGGRLQMPLKPALAVREQWLGVGWAP